MANEANTVPSAIILHGEGMGKISEFALTNMTSALGERAIWAVTVDPEYFGLAMGTPESEAAPTDESGLLLYGEGFSGMDTEEYENMKRLLQNLEIDVTSVTAETYQTLKDLLINSQEKQQEEKWIDKNTFLWMAQQRQHGQQLGEQAWGALIRTARMALDREIALERGRPVPEKLAALPPELKGDTLKVLIDDSDEMRAIASFKTQVDVLSIKEAIEEELLQRVPELMQRQKVRWCIEDTILALATAKLQTHYATNDS